MCIKLPSLVLEHNSQPNKAAFSKQGRILHGDHNCQIRERKGLLCPFLPSQELGHELQPMPGLTKPVRGRPEVPKEWTQLNTGGLC